MVGWGRAVTTMATGVLTDSLPGKEEVIFMRKRQGQAHKATKIDGVQVSKETQRAEPSLAALKGSKDIAWVTAITVGAQLALDIIRVIREATDLKRKLFPGRDGTASAVSGRESN